MIDLDNVMAEVAANTYQEGIDDLHGGQNQYQVLDAGLPVDLAIDMGKKINPSLISTNMVLSLQLTI